MTRREVLSLFAMLPVVPLHLEARGQEKPPPSKPATVTLMIEGMTWDGCISVVRSALLSVKGVTRARVSLEPPEALVDYDASQVSVKQLIEAVTKGEHPDGKTKYSAKEKPPKGK